MVTTAVLVRHAQSTWNAEFRWQGQADPPLSEYGRSQAVRAAGPFAARFGRVDHAVTSPQLRASETADILLAEAGLDVKASRIPDFRERNAGEWSGLTKDEIESRYPGFLASGQRPPGFETDEALFDRVSAALQELHESMTAEAADGLRLTAPNDSIVLVVCHGGVINTLVDRLAPDRIGRVPNLSGWTATIDEKSITMADRFDLLPPAERTGGDALRV